MGSLGAPGGQEDWKTGYAELLKSKGLPDYWLENLHRDPRYQWIHPYVEVRPHPKIPGGKGIFATKAIKAGEPYFNGDFMGEGLGQVEKISDLMTWPDAKLMKYLHWAAQISETELLAPRLDDDGVPEDFGAYVNHSCDPTITFDNGTFNMKVRKDMVPGDEITIDYAQFAISEIDLRAQSFECTCGAPWCRKFLNYKDHLLPELIERYGNDFPPHTLESQRKNGAIKCVKVAR